MNPILLVVDLQNDFLARRPIEPDPALVVARAARLLAACRESGVPVVHVRMTVTRDPDNRLPHWKRDDRWICVENTPGHAPPAALAPLPSEPILAKPGFSAFDRTSLGERLDHERIDTVLIAGLFLHNCVRATAIDAWLRNREVIVAEDATGSYDALEAESTTALFQERGIRLLSVRAIIAIIGRPPGSAAGTAPAAVRPGVVLSAAGSRSSSTSGTEHPDYLHRPPASPGNVDWGARFADGPSVRLAVGAARAALPALRSAPPATRRRWLEDLARKLAAPGTIERLAGEVAVDVGKPLRDARGEIARARALVESAARHATDPAILTLPEDRARTRRTPLGVIAAITPWNHPVAIALGKIAPAIAHGNAVVWKPAPAASRAALSLRRLMDEAGWPDDIVRIVLGGAGAARALMSDPGIDAITLTGGGAAGAAAQRIAALRHIPLQAELGGNNVAVVWTDADLDACARLIAPAGFGFAGQRCTANRRVVVERRRLDRFVDHLAAATRDLVWGDPLSESTVVGPMISEDALDRIECLLAAAIDAGHRVVIPHRDARPAFERHGFYHPPAIVVCDDPGAGIVRRESFGPVIVVQPADDWEQAIALADGVDQGLVASVFTASDEKWAAFRDRIRAGILKRNQATADAGVEAPFGGWKASGIGPPEHGAANIEFHTRSQTLYDDQDAPPVRHPNP